MQKALRQNRSSAWAFALCAACLFIPVALVLTFALYGEYSSSAKEYDENRRVQSEQVSALIAAQFNAIDSAAYEILNSNWHVKLASRSGVWDGEFTCVKVKEIMDDLKFKVAMLGIVKDILVPVRELAVSPLLYTPEATYASLPSATIDLARAKKQASTFAILPSGDENELALLYKTTASPDIARSVILIVNRQSLSSLLERINLSQFSGIQIFDANAAAPLVAVGAQARGSEKIKRRANRYQIIYEYESYISLYGRETAANAAIYGALALMSSLTLSFIFTRYYAAPVERLVKYSLRMKNAQRARRNLSSYVDELIASDQKNIRAITRYSGILEKSVYFSMLSDPAFDFGDAVTLLALPESCAQLPYFLMLLNSRDADAFISELDEKKRFYGIFALRRFNLPTSEECAIAWTPHVDTCASAIAAIARDFCGVPLAFSNAYLDLRSIQSAYARLRRDFTPSPPNRAPALPLGFEVELISLLQRQAGDEIPLLIDRLRAQGEEAKTAAYDLLRRFAKENQLEMPGGEAEGWAKLSDCASGICEQLKNIHARGEKDIERVIDDILEDQYGNSELSLKYLSDKLGVSQAALSRTYKAKTGRNYYERLTDIRMTRAASWIKTTNKPLSEISGLVGYDSYLSFKRAFTNFHGKSPREYREAISETT